MCGILAYLSATTPVTRKAFDTMLNELKARGPDGSGTEFLENDRVALGHQRLAIIDLSKNGGQPMCNENGKLWLTFNGEIYNHLTLRSTLESKGHHFKSQCDAEVILHSYEEWGMDCVNKFRGIFAFVIWDEIEHRAFCARDHFGVKPFYYLLTKSGIIIASQPRAITASPTTTKSIDSQSLVDYLTFGIVPHDRGIFKGIKKLPPAHTLVWEAGNTKSSIYWKPSFTGTITDRREAIQRTRSALRHSVESQLLSDVPVATYLSGGIDSSLITAIANESSSTPLEAITVGFNESASDERKYAKMVVNHFGLRQHEFVLSQDSCIELLDSFAEAFDEPYGLGAAFPMLLIAKATQQLGIKVVLAGDGADELFAGYFHYDEFEESFKYWGRDPAGRIRDPIRALKSFFRKWHPLDDYSPHEASIPVNQQKATIAEEIFTRSEKGRRSRYRKFFQNGLRAVTSAQLMDIHTYLPDEILVKVDRSTMACGVEARVPFLDPDLADLVFSFHTSILYEQGERKSLLKAAAKEWLPDSILTKRKKGFSIPLETWLTSTTFLEGALDQLDSGTLREIGILNSKCNRESLISLPRPTIWQLFLLEKWATRWAKS